ncbi:MAG: methionyl-tRNA formyltransferase [Lachnospiraceae bacterium]|nr:methionyl-tRNA formyltransferase [Lachnospiraceae bacterium]
MKIIYMGTPDFAVGPLKAIIDAGYEVTAVVTQPDKPKGRSDKLIPSPVKAVAVEHGIPVLQPVRLRDPESIAELSAYPADIIVVAAFGQILPAEVLNYPRFGCVNIHASLLPHLRGASPIQHAILMGDKESGVTIMQMDEGLDTGDILIQESIPITADDTGGSLFDKLAVLGAELIVRALPLIEQGKLTPIPQDETCADHVGMLKKSMGQIDFSRPAVEIERQVRGMDPWPGAYTTYKDKQLKLWKTACMSVDDLTVITANKVDITQTGNRISHPGTVIFTDRSSVYVSTGDGILRIDELQLEGKKRMSVRDFLLGQHMEAGDRLS